jgi:hypothetical protein
LGQCATVMDQRAGEWGVCLLRHFFGVIADNEGLNDIFRSAPISSYFSKDLSRRSS